MTRLWLVLVVAMTAIVAPTLSEIRRWPATVDVPTAASALGISKSTAYEWIRLGEFPVPVISVRHKHRVPTAGLVRLLSTGEAGPDAA
jgi:hypothetical protein